MYKRQHRAYTLSDMFSLTKFAKIVFQPSLKNIVTSKTRSWRGPKSHRAYTLSKHLIHILCVKKKSQHLQKVKEPYNRELDLDLPDAVSERAKSHRAYTLSAHFIASVFFRKDENVKEPHSRELFVNFFWTTKARSRRGPKTTVPILSLHISSQILG